MKEEESPHCREKGSSGVAIKNDPKLWAKAKEKACSEGGMCKHSARKMQWAVHYYKSHGGTYAGKKSPSNKLHQWTKQKWRTASGKSRRATSVPSGGSLEAPDQEADQGDEPAEAERVREREAVGEAAEGRGARRKEVPPIAKVMKKKISHGVFIENAGLQNLASILCRHLFTLSITSSHICMMCVPLSAKHMGFLQCFQLVFKRVVLVFPFP